MSVSKHMNSEIELGILQMQILWLLSRKSTHGYELMKSLNSLKKTKITQGTLYPTLQRLEELKLVSRKQEKRKIIYNLTPKGRKAMTEGCNDFARTFFGIFNDFVCGRCSQGEMKNKERLE
ncbi:MAG: PadR family transcriptional regulator [Candidatus Woesearchaeota archaeon]|nr:PadR family transcriptional regulator [Candidatus Woesearchaeota archaeon]